MPLDLGTAGLRFHSLVQVASSAPVRVVGQLLIGVTALVGSADKSPLQNILLAHLVTFAHFMLILMLKQVSCQVRYASADAKKRKRSEHV